MNELSLSSGSGLTQPSGALARRVHAELEQIGARSQLAFASDQARAGLIASAMNNVGMLTTIGRQIVKVAPEAAEHLDILLTAYAVGAARQVSNFR